MLLVQGQYVQDSRKNFDSEFQLKQNTSKQVFSDPKEIWEIESGCEEEAITSGNDTEGEDNVLYPDPSDIPEEILESRGQINYRKKNVRFGDHFNYVLDTSETSSLDNEYVGVDCGYLDPGRKRSLSQDPEINSYKVKEHFRVPQKSKWRTRDCVYDKVRPKSSPEKTIGYLEGLEKRQISLGEYDNHRMKRKENLCGRHHYGDFDEVTYRRPSNKSYKFDCGDVVIPRCCEYCYEKKTYGKMKSTSTPKHACHMIKDTESETKNHRKLRLDSHHDQQVAYHTERHFPEDYYEHVYSSKTKKKTLEAVQEQQEQFSDSTYKVPCTKYSSQTIPGELSRFSEKLNNPSISDWLYYGGRGNGGSTGPPRIHKMRSRRTRMNKIKNGWKKALVQTVRDGSRNERVGVIVMGSKGPEFYSKNSKPGPVPFRKSKSFLDGAAKSFEVMTVDCKNVFLSSSEPGPRTNHAINDLVCPEDDEKISEKIARYSKNVSDIVKNSEEKFYKTLSTSEYPEKKNTIEGMYKGAGEGIQEEIERVETKDEVNKSKISFHFPTFDSLSPRIPKSLRKPEKKISVDSKAMADALNEQAKQYIENQSNLKDREESFLEGLKELKEKYPPKQISQETIEANLSLWGIKLEQLSGKSEIKDETAENNRKDDEKKAEENEKIEKDQISQMGSVRSNDQSSIIKQIKKKTYEQTSGRDKLDEEEITINSKPHSEITTPKRMSAIKKLESPKNSVHPEPNLISAVFRDLVENGCAISQEESENLQSIFNQTSYNTDIRSHGIISSASSEVINTTRDSKINASPRSPKTPTSLEEKFFKEIEKEEKQKTKREYKREKGNDDGRKNRNRDFEGILEAVTKRKVVKMKNNLDEKVPDLFKKLEGKQKEGKTKKKNVLDEKMRLLRQALPSLAAENEATHLKQLKKYIDRFIDRVEASTTSEYSKRKEIRHKSKGSPSTDSSEVRVDACKILDIVSNPFKKISSEVTINIAKKLTDTLVQDKSTKVFSALTKSRKQSENETDDEGFLPCNTSSASERCEESEPVYLKQLKKMRNEHLNNILLEVKRLSELLRFLDRCNRLHF